MKNQLSALVLLLFISIAMNSQVPENEQTLSLKISETTYMIPLKEIADKPGWGSIIELQIPDDYSFLKNIPDIECDLSSINSFKMNQYVRNDSVPNQIYMFVGINESKKEKYVIVDANNNHDFSDDELYTFAIPEEPLTREEKLEKCVGVEITLNPPSKDVGHIGVDAHNYFGYKNGMPQDERLRVVITFGDYMVTETRLGDIPIEIDASHISNMVNRRLDDRSDFIIRYKDKAGDLGYRSFRKGDTIQLQDRRFELTKVEHPIYT